MTIGAGEMEHDEGRRSSAHSYDFVRRFTSGRVLPGRRRCTASKLRDCLSFAGVATGEYCSTGGVEYSNEREYSCSRGTTVARTVGGWLPRNARETITGRVGRRDGLYRRNRG